MDLKLKDVAEELNVSESTIRRWVADGKIPAYRLHGQLLFSRIEIQEWVMHHKMPHEQEGAAFGQRYTVKAEGEHSSETKGGNKQFSLYRAINKGGVYNDIQGTTKEDVIRNTMKKLAKPMNLDGDVLGDLLLDREKLHSTALNHGIAVPHTRDFLLSAGQDVVTVAFPSQPIPYGSLDNQPVHTLFFLFASQDKRHLHLLAKIAHLSSNPKAVEFLKTRPSKDKLLEYIRQWESAISQT